MRTGLVLGKFMPIHAGHIQLIEFALKQCDLLVIWICTSKQEPISGKLRLKWMRETLKDLDRIEIVHFRYDESLLPNTSESSHDVSEIWTGLIKQHLPPIDVIVTCEKYGDFVAEMLHIEHKHFEFPKNISATAIRKDPYKNWEFIPYPVKSFFYRKVCILGTESTGKSTLTRKLARFFDADFVSETARGIVENSNSCRYEDLIEISRKHAESIVLKEKNLNRMLFIDTNISITKSYSKFLFNRELTVDKWIEKASKCHLYLYLESDFPYIQDGTRLSEADRNALDEFHKKELIESKIHFYSIRGNWENHLDEAIKIIREKFGIQ
jgi:HTH-type transcriptional regulator, transcriptional repressor of NAD biosynthesis genes